MNVTVTVTADDIEEGTAGDCFECAVARAAGRLLNARHVAQVYSDSLVVLEMLDEDEVPMPGWVGAVAELPQDITHRILQMDRGHVPAPFAFPVDLPEEVLRAG